MFVLTPVLLLSVAYIVINLLLVFYKNYQGQKFFKLLSPDVPVLPTSIFHGNIDLLYNNKSFQLLDDLHKKYGPTFGCFAADHPIVSTVDLDLIKHIELDDPHSHINRMQVETPLPELNDSIFFINDDKWRRIRKAVGPAMTKRYIKSDDVSRDIENILDKLVEGLEFRLDQATEANSDDGKRAFLMDADDITHRFALAVIFSFLYKRDNDIDFKSKKDTWTETMLKAERVIAHPMMALTAIFPFTLPLVRLFLPLHFIGKMRYKTYDFIYEATDINRKARSKYEQLCRANELSASSLDGAEGKCPVAPSFHEIKSSGDFRRHLVDTIIDSFLDKKMNQKEFLGTTSFLLYAGFETTADTMTYLLWQLTRNPDIQERLRKDIEINGEGSEYLHWCVMEAIRLHPAVPLGTGRILGHDVTVNGLKLAKGTFVMPSTYAIHHDPEVWPEPEVYKPERWQKSSVGRHPSAFLGFGLGPRNCVGANLALHETKLLVRTLLARYRLEECEATTKVYNFSTAGLLFTTLDQPIKMRLVALDGPVKTEVANGSCAETP